MKKLFKVIFKNGEKEVISQEIANHIREIVLSGTKTFLCVTDSKGDLIMAINLLEVEYIIDMDFKV